MTVVANMAEREDYLPYPAGDWRTVLPLVALTYLYILVPIEIRPLAFGVNLPIYRIGIIVCLPFLLHRGLSKRFFLADWLMMMAGIWLLIGFCENYGFQKGLIRGAGVAIDTFGAYLLGRLAIEDVNALRRFLVLVSPVLCFAGFEMLVESVTDRLIVRPLFSDLIGGLSAYKEGNLNGLIEFANEKRLGLLRAYGPFSHPILAGALLTSTIPLWFKATLRGWPLWAGLVAAACGFFSVSSAAFLGILLAALFLLVDWAKNYVSRINWPVISLLLGFGVLAIEVLSTNGISVLIARYTLNPQTAFYRLLIWEYGTKSVAQHPWIGIGYTLYDRPVWMNDSIDAHFLYLAVRSGLIVPGLILVVIASSLVRTGIRATREIPVNRDMLVGLNFSLAILVSLSMTVNYFAEANVWFMMMVGISVSLSVPRYVRSFPARRQEPGNTLTGLTPRFSK